MDVIDRWVLWLAHNRGRSEVTVTRYRQHLDGLRGWLAEKGVDLVAASLQDVEAFCGIEAHKRGLSPRSRRPLVAAVRMFFSWAHREGLSRQNPAAALSYPKSGMPLPTALSLKNAERLMMAPDLGTFLGVRDAAMLALLVGTGIRVSGLVSLNESSLQWVEYQGQEWLVLKVCEKGKKERLVPAPHEARLLVRAYLGHPDLAEIDRTLPDGDRVLFVSVRNRLVPAHEYFGESRRLRARHVNQIIEDYGRDAGIPREQLHPHAARHLYGTELAEAGADVLRIQALMGHGSPHTSAIYTRMAMRTLADQVATANPLGKMRTPVSNLVRAMSRT